LLVAEEEGCAGLRDGFAVERESLAARRGDNPDGYCRSGDYPIAGARQVIDQFLEQKGQPNLSLYQTL
jgi:hypothetical protein